jgi:hypothetical protein
MGIRFRLPVAAALLSLVNCGPTYLADGSNGGALIATGGDGAGGSGVGGGSVGGGGAGPTGQAGQAPLGCGISVIAPDVVPPASDSWCHCTRRPGAGQSYECPVGAGTSSSAEVGPEGGTVQLSGTESTRGVPVELRIQPGALGERVVIRITETTLPPPAGFEDWSPIYHFEPEGLTLAVPAELRIPWTTGGVTPTGGFSVGPELMVFWSHGNPCELSQIDSYRNAGFSQANVQRLGYGVAGVARVPSGCP